MSTSGNHNTESNPAKNKGARNGGQHLLAAVISVLIIVCLLTACGLFLVYKSLRPAASSQQSASSPSEPASWLGLDPVVRILSPGSESPVAYTFSDGTDQDPSQKKDAGPAQTASPNPAAADKEAAGISAAASADSTKAASAAASADPAIAASKDSTSEKAAPSDKTAEKSDKAAGKTKAQKDSSDEEASKKEKESEKDKDKEKKDKEDKDKDKDKDKDIEDSLTKTQKKYVQAWEENHYRTFPLNTELHDYNWKYLKYDDDGRLHYKGDDDYTVRRGIDVSEFQGQIDWEKVKKAGYDFAFVRAGHRTFHTGSLERDTRAIKNLTRAQKAGLDVGVYVFSQAITIEEAIEEAELCLDVIEESKVKITLPVVFDPEIQIEYDARINYISSDQFTNNAVAFCETIKDAGYTPGIYANCSTETDILNMSRLENAEIWYADYNSVPESPYRFTYWQYTNMGWVDGIPETETDLNFWFVKKEKKDER